MKGRDHLWDLGLDPG